MPQPLSFSANHATLNLGALKKSCSACSMHQLCLPTGLEDADIDPLDQIIGRRRRVERDEPLYKMNEPFRNLYAVRFGHFETCHINASGEAQVTGFQMAGELLGMDAISGELSRFRKQGWLQVDKRDVTLLDPARLKAMAAGTEQCSPMA
jgi:CRP/FNR family transcriptional regulator